MSALRKLRQLKMNADAAAAATSAVEEEREEKPAAQQPARNAFDMLADEEEEEEQQEEQAAEEHVATEPAAADEDAADAVPLAAAPAPKPKVKKVKGEATAPKPGGGGNKRKKGAAAATAAAPEKEAWEIEFANAQAESAQANQSAGVGAGAATAAATSVWNVLRTEARSLDAQQEIRAVFGSGMERRGGGGGDDDGAAAAAAQGVPGRNQGGFRRGGAATVRRVKMATSGTSSATSSSSSSSRRMLVRPNPAWPRTDSSGLIKVGFVQPEQAPVPPPAARAVTKVATGMHGNIHSLASASDVASSATAASASSAAADEEAQAARAQSEHAAALLRYQRQQQLVLSPGVRIYQFVQSGEFQRVQEEYLQCVGSHDVQQLSYFSRLHPFHPAALLTMADILASQSEFATAHDFIQRCLFVHENGFVGSAEFADKLARGEARMDGTAAENEAFFTALARHAQTLGKKGCPRTALEVCKLLLSLSPLLDPTSTLLAIDFYAIRAKQFRWMIDFAGEMDRAVVSAFPLGQHPWSTRRTEATGTGAGAAPASNVATLSAPSPASSSSSASASAAAAALPAPRPPCTFLPSLMFSRALAAWHLENEAANGGDKKKRGGGSASAVSASSSSASAAAAAPLFTGVVQPPTLPSAATGHSMVDEAEAALLTSDGDATRSASYLLQQALLMWPSVVQPLLAAAGAVNTLARPAWTAALGALNALYATSFLSSSTAAPASTPFLAKLELIYAERSSSLWKSDKIQSWLLANMQQLASSLAASPSPYTPEVVARFTQARMRFLLSLPFPAAIKSLQKSAYSDHVAQLPPELLMAQQHAGAFDVAGERARARADDMAAAGHQQLDLQQHPLRVFLQSLLPWFAPPEAGVEGEEGAGAGAGAGGAGAGLPANVDEAMERLQQLPPEEQAELLRTLMLAQERDDGDEEEQEEEQTGGGGGDYQDYEFDD